MHLTRPPPDCRENDVRSYERLKEIRENLVSAASIMEAVMAREAKKREIVQHEVDEQRLQLRLHRAEATAHDGIAAEMLSALKDRARRAMLDDSGPRRGHDDGMDGRRGAPMGIPRGGRRGGLRISLSRRSPLHAVADLGPGPLPPEPMALFGDEGMDVDLERVEKAMLVGLPKGIPRSAVRARFGRGGRLVLDRCDPLTGVLYGEAGGGGEPMEVDS